MRTTYVIDDLSVGGAQMHLAALVGELSARGWAEVEVVSMGPVSPLVAARLPPAVALTRFALESVRSARFPLEFLRLVRHLRRRRPAIVHTYLNTAGVFGLLAARLAGVRVVITSRRDVGVFRSGRVRRLEAWLSRRWADRVFCVCQAVARVTRAEERIPEASIRVLYNGVPLPPHPVPSRPEAEGPVRFCVVAAVNRKEKGHREFLDAARLVRQEEPGTEFLVAGDGPLRRGLERAADSLGLSDAVRFLGETSAVGALLEAVDVVVVPSWTEGISNAALEAMARGLPVIASAVDGNLELVRDGSTGLLVPPRDPQALAAAMLAYVRQPRLRATHGRAGRARVESEFSVDRMIARYTEEYAALASPPPPGGPRRRIALVESSSGIGGTAKCVYQLTRTLDATRYAVYVFARRKVGWPARVEAGGRAMEVLFTGIGARRPRPSAFRVVNYVRKAAELARVAPQAWYFLRRFRSRRIDLVHTNNNLLDQLPAILAAGLLRLPVVCQLHDQVALSLVERLAARLVDRFWVLSRSACELYARDVAPGRIDVVPNGLLLDEYRDVPAGTVPTVRHPAVGVVGRLVPWKGQETLLRAAPLVRAEVPDARFYLVGDDPAGATGFFDHLRALAAQLGCADALEFTGWLEDPRPLVRQLDVSVCPSLQPEPFGLVILESMALGVPVVATRHGGPLDIIEHGRDGFLFPPGDERELARLLVSLLRERPLRESVAAAAREKVAQRYAMEAISRRVEEGYERLLRGRPPRAGSR